MCLKIIQNKYNHKHLKLTFKKNFDFTVYFILLCTMKMMLNFVGHVGFHILLFVDHNQNKILFSVFYHFILYFFLFPVKYFIEICGEKKQCWKQHKTSKRKELYIKLNYFDFKPFNFVFFLFISFMHFVFFLFFFLEKSEEKLFPWITMNILLYSKKKSLFFYQT